MWAVCRHAARQPIRGSSPAAIVFGSVVAARAMVDKVQSAGKMSHAECTSSLASAASSQKRPKCSLASLHEIVSDVRKSSPPYLVSISDPRQAPLIVGSRGELQWPSADKGPWDVAVMFQGDLADPIYIEPFRARLRFSDRWPLEPPELRFHGFLIHPMLDEQRSPPQSLYAQLQRNDDGEILFQDMLETARCFFLDPCDAFRKLVGRELEWMQRLQASVERARRFNDQRLDIIRRYLQLAKHPELFDCNAPLQSDWFAPDFWEAHKANTPEAWKRICTEHQIGEIFSMPIFTESFCDMLVDEIFNFYASGLPANRPNSMNSYGVILNDIGLEWFVNKLQEMLQPIGDIVFPGAGNGWDGHHCFIVRYRESEDLGLDMHTDDSDVTFNICLGLDFTGAGLQFCGVQGSPEHRQHHFTYQHVKGRCTFHLGRKRHGADDITSGERLNLILWNHSSVFRTSADYLQPDYYREASPPNPICVSYTHDRDYGIFKEYPKGQESFRGRGWCPPEEAQYDDFEADSQQSRL